MEEEAEGNRDSKRQRKHAQLYRALIFGPTRADYKDKPQTAKTTIQLTLTQIMTSKELFLAGVAES